VTPWLSSASAEGVIPARPMVALDGETWVARPRGVSRVAWRDGKLLQASMPLPEGATTEPDGLLLLDDAVAAIVRNDCQALTLVRFLPPPKAPALAGGLRLCGRLVAKPWVARSGRDILAYVVFDAIGDPDGRVELPFAQIGATVRSLASLGPVYYPVRRETDVLLRAVIRCDQTLTACSARTFVSPRADRDALWADADRLAIAFAARARSDLYLLPSAAAPPRFATAPDWVFGLTSLPDGRLALLRSAKPFRSHPASLSVVVIDGRWRVREGVSMPPPVTGRFGHWTWAVHAGRLVYGPSRTNNLGGADTPRAFVATLPDGPVETQGIAPSVDTVLFAGDEAVLVGADRAGVLSVVRRPLAQPGSWAQHPHASAGSGYDQGGRTLLVEVGARRFLVVPYPDMQYWARYRLRVLELVRDAVILRGDFGSIAPPVDDDRLAADATDGHLLLRFPGEMVLVEVTTSGGREVARLPL
jgi:hypothetical protein